MSILSELQSRKLGLIELILMGFDVYFKNLKPILLAFAVILLPFMIILEALVYLVQIDPNRSVIFWIWYLGFLILVSLMSLIYFIALSIITENFVNGRKTSYQSVVRQIASSFIPLFLLGIRFGINYFLRCLLLFIPGIIYLVNNQYYGLAFILRDQRGKAAFAYSRSIVKGNWWRVLFFGFLSAFVIFGSQAPFKNTLSTVPFINDFIASVLSQVLPQFIAIGIGVGSILLFLNLDYQKSLEMNTNNDRQHHTNNDRQHLKILSIFHYILGGILAFFSLLFLIHFFTGIGMITSPESFPMESSGEPVPKEFGYLLATIGGTMVLLGEALAIATIVS
jgi:hypothetical protein